MAKESKFLIGQVVSVEVRNCWRGGIIGKVEFSEYPVLQDWLLFLTDKRLASFLVENMDRRVRVFVEEAFDFLGLKMMVISDADFEVPEGGDGE